MIVLLQRWRLVPGGAILKELVNTLCQELSYDIGCGFRKSVEKVHLDSMGGGCQIKGGKEENI